MRRSNRAIIPVWKPLCINKRQEKPFVQGIENCSDHGCCGLDITVQPNIAVPNEVSVHVKTLKEQTNKLSLCGRCCCCPFYKPNEISNIVNPYLSDIDRAIEKEVYFLDAIRWRSQILKKELQPLRVKLKDEELQEKLRNEYLTLSQRACRLVEQVPSSFPSPVWNWLTAGNGMASTSSNTLLHAGGNSLSDLVVTTLTTQNKESSEVLKGGHQQTLKLKGGLSYGISYRQTLGRDLCMVRKKKMLHVLLLRSNKEMDSTQADSVARLKSKVDIASSSLSPHIPGEYAVLNTDGDLELHTYHHSLPIWSGKSHHHKDYSSLLEHHWLCDFGSHPRALLYMDRLRLVSCDIRGKKKKLSEVFLCQKNKYLFNNEELFLFQQSDANPFQYFISTTYHLLVADERFPNIPFACSVDLNHDLYIKDLCTRSANGWKNSRDSDQYERHLTVQLWKHNLKHFPILMSQAVYSESKSIESNQLLLLATQRPQETCCFQIQPSSPQPVSLCPPWYCSAPEDSARILSYQGLNVPEAFKTRASMPVTGICSVPHDSGVTIFHQTSVGDLFYQDYFLPVGTEEEKTHRAGLGYTPPDSQLIFKRIQRWLGQGDSPVQCAVNYPHLNWTSSSKFFEAVVENEPRPTSCGFCVESATEIVEDQKVCPTCRQNPLKAGRISQAKDKLGVCVTGDSVKDNPEKEDIKWLFNLTNMERKYDPYTEKLREVWTSSEKENVSDKRTEEEEWLLSLLYPETSLQEKDSLSTPQDQCDDVTVLDNEFSLPAQNGSTKRELPSDSFAQAFNHSEKEHLSSQKTSQDLYINCDDIIPPSQDYADYENDLSKKRLSFLKRKRINISGF